MQIELTKDPVLHSYDGRCVACYMRLEKCICELIPRIENKTRVSVVMHVRESYKTTNTARIACMALNNSEIQLRGVPHQRVKLEWSNSTPLLLTLSDDAQILSPELIKQISTPIHLVVPDGNWGQASRMRSREPDLKNLTRVKLPAGLKPMSWLRNEYHPEGMSTLEAIARALGIIESESIQNDLMSLFTQMVTRTLETRPRSM